MRRDTEVKRCMGCDAPSATWPWCQTCCDREGVSVRDMHQLPDLRSHDEAFFKRIDEDLKAGAPCGSDASACLLNPCGDCNSGMREFNPPGSAITRNQARLLAEKIRLCADGKPCGVPPEPGGDRYCDECPNRTDEDSSAVGSKDDADKPRMDLLLSDMPHALEAIAHVLTYGAKKYSAGGWMNVPDAQRRYLAAGMRHEIELAKGVHHDAETGEHHLAHAACCLLFRLELALREDF